MSSPRGKVTGLPGKPSPFLDGLSLALIENASGRNLTSTRSDLSEAFPIKASDNPLGIIRLDWRMAVMRQLDRCPRGVGYIKAGRW